MTLQRHRGLLLLYKQALKAEKQKRKRYQELLEEEVARNAVK